MTLPAPRQGSACSSEQLLVTSAGRQHPGVCSCCCWAPWWEPVPRTQPSGITRHLPGSNLPRISCSDLTGAESCMAWQRFPEWFQGKAVWERRSSRCGKGGGKESLLFPGCCSDHPQSTSKYSKSTGNYKKSLLTQTFPKGCWQEK